MNSGEEFLFPEMAVIRQPACSRLIDGPQTGNLLDFYPHDL